MNRLQQVFDHPAPVALVTGSGAPRVGRAIAVELAQHGCRVALHANTSGEQAQQAADRLRDQFGQPTLVTCGAVEEDGVAERLVEETRQAFGRLDILVNSAAIWWPTPLEKVTAAELRRYFDVNTVGSFLCARAAGEVMSRQPQGGSIVNLGDWATVRPYLDHAAYFPSKGSIDVMTRSLAVELATRHRRLRVNCIKPGPVLLAEDVGDRRREKLCASTLSGEIGTAEHVAHAVRFLCENTFVNGVCLPVDGGRSIYCPDGLQVGENTG
jgi:NAD(P)-dependent dehydrogenase (short-subunit alcohol dehydrogenase family)